ncbi:MAG: MotA/TolQ/ExbB proton channel family protein [Deferribacteres bacterium]|nr:MotA/TolQ/ExbB proton channel family protein [candidate division KSB1 bacterium]MCB9508928.1 MotA/TolQ/ExbB proton channel family protein [Deferribacteres bacterium]
MNSPLFSSLLWLQSVAQLPGNDLGVMTLVWRSSLFTKVILIALIILSVISWTITINKYLQFKNFNKTFTYNLNLISPNVDLTSFFAHAIEKRDDEFSRIAEEGYFTLSNAIKKGMQVVNKANEAAAYGGDRRNSRLPDDENFAKELRLRLETGVNTEVLSLSKGMSFIATVVSVSPFIGLLGTVWGVLQAFLGIGTTGSADLAIVAPGIAEALITTVFGLAVAIPAVLCNNYLATQLQDIEDHLDHLITELTIYFSNCWQHEKKKLESHLGRQRDIPG